MAGKIIGRMRYRGMIIDDLDTNLTAQPVEALQGADPTKAGASSTSERL